MVKVTRVVCGLRQEVSAVRPPPKLARVRVGFRRDPGVRQDDA
jgi:hypothetical protein